MGSAEMTVIFPDREGMADERLRFFSGAIILVGGRGIRDESWVKIGVGRRGWEG